LPKRRYLPDVNVLLALSEQGHADHRRTSQWFGQIGDSRWLLCPVTEAGFVRLSANPLVGGRDIGVAIAILQQIRALPNCLHLPIVEKWIDLVSPFATRLLGYRQVTDALLLGLAIRHRSVLVTLDQHLQALAGTEFRENVLILR
jgi:uncharacterized protein